MIQVPNRYLAGITEVDLNKHIENKINWRKMLTNTVTDKNLETVKEKLKAYTT